MIKRTILILFLLATILPGTGLAKEPASRVGKYTFQVIGLFSPEREKDFGEIISKQEGIRLLSVAFTEGLCVFEFDPQKQWPGSKPEQLVELMDQAINSASRGSFRINAQREKPLSQYQKLEIAVQGLDCKGCALGVSRMLSDIPGVERVIVDWKGGRIVAYVDSAKVDQKMVEKKLKDGGVEIPEKKG